MKKFDEEAAAALEKVSTKAQKKLDNMTLTALQFSAVLAQTEGARKRMHESLVSYKTETLIEKRTQIKMLERDLERLNAERDNLEEQRESMDEEVAGLEAQVREIEDQMRDHNRNSSMSNGRINVAHARKKRRLDSELERILELIEQRRLQMSELDERVGLAGRARDEKENRMIDLEKDLVQVLLEQQKMVLGLVESAKFEDKNKVLTSVAALPWPPKQNATIGYVKSLRKEREESESKKKKKNEDREDGEDGSDNDGEGENDDDEDNDNDN
jgi:hypothetical protein